MKSLHVGETFPRRASLLGGLRDFDQTRRSLPGEHWAAFAIGLYLVLRRRRSAAGRVAAMIAGSALVARALSGRDGAVAMYRRAESRDAEGPFIDVAMPWPYDERVRIGRDGASEERSRRR